MKAPSASQLRQEFFKGDTGLFEDALERAGFEGFVLRDNDRDALFAQHQVRAALANGKKSQTL